MDNLSTLTILKLLRAIIMVPGVALLVSRNYWIKKGYSEKKIKIIIGVFFVAWLIVQALDFYLGGSDPKMVQLYSKIFLTPLGFSIFALWIGATILIKKAGYKPIVSAFMLPIWPIAMGLFGVIKMPFALFLTIFLSVCAGIAGVIAFLGIYWKNRSSKK